jgi:DNA-directed RNA polymerase delta subunit
MDEAKEKIRELTLQRLRQSGRETAAHQLIEVRKDSNEWKEFVDEINAVTGGPAESSQFMNDLGRYYEELRKDPERLQRETDVDVEWQIGAWNLIQDDPWFD